MDLFLSLSCQCLISKNELFLHNEIKVGISYKSINSLSFFFFLPLASKCCVVLTDLGNFSGRTRSAVSVREGQGVVLMCSPPPHSPGTVGSRSILLLLSFYYMLILLNSVYIPGEKYAWVFEMCQSTS